ncbi:hypothetical protein AX17_000419 [Amanita inopinata Kibby_2008]|nr:hypothetical protein AX17_000419 [Amanita inopinata Kibby_2008]
MRKKAKTEEPEVYHVEVITAARVAPVTDSTDDEPEASTGNPRKKKKDRWTARWEYFVKWAGYDSDQNSWEPEENVADCQRLLASFWEHIGLDNEDYPVGYTVPAKEHWIKREKKFFAREYSNAQERLRKKREQEERERSRKPKKKGKSAIEGPSRPRSGPSFKRSKQTTADVGDVSSSDSDEDKPLSKIVVPFKRKVARLSSDDDSIVEAVPMKIPKKSHFTKEISENQAQEEENSPEGAPSPSSLFMSSPPPEVPAAQPRAQIKPIPLPALKKPLAPAKQIKRLVNPHIKIAAGAVDTSASNSAISTKQRLSQMALDPVLPKSSSFPMPPTVDSDKRRLILTPTEINPLTTLNFKRRPSVTQNPTIHVNQDQSIGTSTDTNTTSTSAQLTKSTGEQMHKTAIREDRKLSSSSKADILDHEPLRQAELFLRDIMPPELAGPIMPILEIEQEALPPKAFFPRKIPPPTRIPKKWKWTGSLVLEESDRLNELCNVTIQDCTEPLAMALRLNIVMTGVEKIIASSFHDFADASTFLRACHPASQLARIVPQSDTDASSLMTLRLYMSKNKQIILTPVSLDEHIVGHMLLFPPNNSDLCQRFNVPSQLQQYDSLIVALLPWKLSSKQIALDWRNSFVHHLARHTSIEPTIADSARWERSIRTKVSYHHALRILKFPNALHDFMVQEHRRPFCIWWEGGDSIKGRMGVETAYLSSIMEQCRAANVGSKAAARVVFVHVGALATVHKLPGFTERRTRQPLVHFYIYGSHECVAPDVWGVREIWPCGGIITFTPQSVLDDFQGVLHRIRQVHAHPLWACYIMPSVLGMIARLTCRNEDPLHVYDRDEFLHKELLMAINEGDLAMLTAPQHDQYRISASHLSQRWIYDHLLVHAESEREILECAVSSFNTQYSNKQRSEWMSVVLTDISADLSCMQRQPVFMKDYRRYVVLKSEDEVITWNDGLEWATTTAFDFRDDFFPNQD